MARSTWPTVLTGDSWSASQHNTYGRDNDAAYWVFTTAGDIAVCATSTTLSRLAVGTGYQFLQGNNGTTAPGWGGLHFASVYHNTTQNFTTGVAAAVVFNSEYTDPQGWHSTSVNTSRMTVGTTGYYQGSTYLQYTAAGGSGTYKDNIEFRVNAGAVALHRQMTEVDAFAKIYAITFPIVQMTSGQYAEIYLEQNSGGTRAVQANCIFSLLRVS